MPNFNLQHNPLLDDITIAKNKNEHPPKDGVPLQEIFPIIPNDVTPTQLSSKSWRLNHLYYISDKHSNLILFKPNKAQNHFLLNKSYYNIILKSRQLGFTTLATIDMLDNVLFRTNFHALLISYDDDSAKDLFQKKVQFAFEHLHPNLLSKYKIDSSRSNLLRLDHGESNYSSFKVDNSGRSGTYNHVHVSEFAKICKNYPEKVDDIIRGTFPAVHPPQGQITIESTSEGPTGDFYEMYQEASSLPSNHQYRPKEFKAFFYNWQWDQEAINQLVPPNFPLTLPPDMPHEFIEIQTKHNELHRTNPLSYQLLTDQQLIYWFYLWSGDCKKSWKKLFLEYPLTPEDAFRSSSKILFDLDILTKKLAHAKTIIPEEVNSWLFYHPIDPSHSYILAGDPSEGTGGDDSAASLWDFSTPIPELAATFKDNNTPPDIFAYELAKMGTTANTALIMVERNNHGHATLNTLKGIYPLDFIYKEEVTTKEEDEKTLKLGWHTNLASKPRMFYELSTAINNNLINCDSVSILKEAMKFDRAQLSKIKEKDEETTKHFDLLTTAAIAYQGRSEIQDLSLQPTVTTPSSHENPHSDF